MITSILLFAGGLSAGIIIGGFGGFAISNGVAKLRHVKARTELPDDELYREAYNEVAQLTGDVKVAKKKDVKVVAQKVPVNNDVPLLAGQHWKVIGIKTPVRITGAKDGNITYYDYDFNMACTIGSVAAFRAAAKVVE